MTAFSRSPPGIGAQLRGAALTAKLVLSISHQPTRPGSRSTTTRAQPLNLIFGSPGTGQYRKLQAGREEGWSALQAGSQSQIQILNPYFGTKVTFALDVPLNVCRGNVVALTILTGAPALWKPKACNQTDFGILDPGRCDQAEKASHFGSRVARVNPKPAD